MFYWAVGPGWRVAEGLELSKANSQNRDLNPGPLYYNDALTSALQLGGELLLTLASILMLYNAKSIVWVKTSNFCIKAGRSWRSNCRQFKSRPWHMLLGIRNQVLVPHLLRSSEISFLPPKSYFHKPGLLRSDSVDEASDSKLPLIATDNCYSLGLCPLDFI